MEILKCKQCSRKFRQSKEKEVLCAKCHVEVPPTNSKEQWEEVDLEFKQFAEIIYGAAGQEILIGAMNCGDMLNHGMRLTKLKDASDSIISSKVRVKRNREINRLVEEHQAVQEKIATLQNKLMNAMLLHTNNTTMDTSRSAPNIPLVVNKSSTSPLKKPTSPSKTSVKIPPVIKTENTSVIAIQGSTTDSTDDLFNGAEADQLTPLRRSASVKNRIKAFEELSRRASTGGYDNRKAVCH